MTTADILARQLERSGVDSATYVQGDYRLRLVTGRPGSVCFTLLHEIPPAVWVVLAEGFTLGGAIHYTQDVLGDVAAQGLMRRVVEAQRPAQLHPARPVDGSSASGDLAADA